MRMALRIADQHAMDKSPSSEPTAALITEKPDSMHALPETRAIQKLVDTLVGSGSNEVCASSASFYLHHPIPSLYPPLREYSIL